MTEPDDDILLAQRKASLRRLDRWAYVLDEAVRIPGTNIRVGLDSAIGLLPGVGDAAGAALSSGLIVEALRVRAPKRVWLRMSANTGVDFLFGLVPVLGDVFDIAFQANSRNAALFRRWLEKETMEDEKPVRSSSRLAVFSVIGGLLAALTASVFFWRALFG